MDRLAVGTAGTPPCATLLGGGCVFAWGVEFWVNLAVYQWHNGQKKINVEFVSMKKCCNFQRI